MKQILHIFRKDARQFAGEIFISMAITAFFVLGNSMALRDGDASGAPLETTMILLGGLVPASWWILITRVILAERLVGDTQFWITRPYKWSNLLAAKLLFLLMFLYLPFFLAQVAMLAEAGFQPQLYLAGVFFNLLLLTAACVLPLAALATITSSFARNTLTLLGILLGFATLTAIGVMTFTNQPSGPNSRLGEYLCVTLAVVACSAAMLLQYRLRWVWLARAVLLALPLLIISAFYLASRYDQARMDRLFPVEQPQPSIQFSYVPAIHSSGAAYSDGLTGPMVPVALDLSENGVAEGEAVLAKAVRADITSPDGSRWSSRWQALDVSPLGPGENNIRPQIEMPMAVYEKFNSLPLSVHLVLALTRVRAGGTTSIALPMKRFAVPGFGVCMPRTGWTPILGEVTGIRCVAPERDPPLTFISTRYSSTECTDAPAAPDAGVLGTAWWGGLEGGPAQMNLNPAVNAGVNLSNSQMDNGNSEMRALCPGIPITFTQYSAVGRMQTSVDVQGFYLPKVVATGHIITYTTTTKTKTTPVQ